MANNPTNYIEGLARVSDIVSFVFPFEGEDKNRYLKWLEKNNINEKEYIDKANERGTYVHLAMENYIIEQEQSIIENQDLLGEIMHGYDFIRNNKLNINNTNIEHYICGDFFQGTIDLVEWITPDKIKIKDRKTYGVAKKFYGLPNPYIKPYGKLKKTRLQLSLYAYLFKKQGIVTESISCVYLHETGAYEYELELYNDEEIEKIISAFLMSKIPKEYNININNMIIEIQRSIGQYEYAKTTLDLSKEEKVDGKILTSKEKIDSALSAIEYIKTKTNA